MSFEPAVPLAGHQLIDDFRSGVQELDDWLKRRARANQESGASRTFVVCSGSTVVGYYALASGALELASAPGQFRRNMPDPIPIVVLGRLAVDKAHAGQGLGRSMFYDAAQRILVAADVIGIRGLVVHAISPEAKQFYLRLGLAESPANPMTLVVTLAQLRLGMSRPERSGR